MKSIKYSAGTLQRISQDYFNLILYRGADVVYKATIPQNEASSLVFKSNKIKIIQ